MNAGWKFLRPSPKGKHIGMSMQGRPTDWILPVDGVASGWMPEITEVKAARSGYHFAESAGDALDNVGPFLFMVEAGGRIDRADGISAATTMRLLRKVEAWNDASARLFAADCGEEVLDVITTPSLRRAAEGMISLGRRWAAGDAKESDAERALAAYQPEKAHLAWGPETAAATAAGFACTVVGGWYAALHAAGYANEASGRTIRSRQKERLAALIR